MATSYKLQPNLLESFFDENGDFAVGGTYGTFRAANHDDPKATYIDSSGTVAWVNPAELDAQGVPIDASNNRQPRYWADDEPYYVVVKDNLGNIIYEVDNFPYPADSTPTDLDPENFSYIQNNQFRLFPQASYTNPGTSIADLADAGWSWEKTNTSATDSLTFTLFSAGQTDVPQWPVYYLNYTCTAEGSGYSKKDVIYTINDVSAFQAATMNFQLQAKSSTASTIEILVTQNFGTSGTGGPTPSTEVTTPITTFVLTTSWSQYTATFDMPSISGKVLGDQNDGYIQIRIRMPLDQASNIDMTNVDLKQGSIITDYRFKTENQVREEANSLKLPNVQADDVGKMLAVNSDYDFGYRNTAGMIEMWAFNVTDGNMATVLPGCLKCNNTSYFYEDYPLLGERIGTSYGYGVDAFESSTDGSDDLLATCVTAGTASVATDNDTGFTFTQVSAGSAVPCYCFYYSAAGKFGIRNTVLGGRKTAAGAGTSGFTVAQTVNGTIRSYDLVDVTCAAASTLSGGEYWVFSTTTVDYYVWYTVNGAGSDPSPGGTGILVALLSTDTADQVRQKTVAAVSGGASTLVTTAAASTLSGGEYWLMSTTTTDYYIWYTVDNVGDDPDIDSTRGIQVDLDGSDTATQVATKTATAMNAVQFRTPLPGMFVRNIDVAQTISPDDGVNIYGTTTSALPPSTQLDQNKAHTHGIARSEFTNPGGTGVSGLLTTTKTEDTDYIANSGGDEARPTTQFVLMTIRYV